jgi:hypothetical protein
LRHASVNSGAGERGHPWPNLDDEAGFLERFAMRRTLRRLVRSARAAGKVVFAARAMLNSEDAVSLDDQALSVHAQFIDGGGFDPARGRLGCAACRGGGQEQQGPYGLYRTRSAKGVGREPPVDNFYAAP